jgi:tartrate dehydrogenase/decarboxylase/D-malate dehydrogenase
MRTHKIAAIGGDGIGPEVVNAGLDVLETIATSDGSFRFQVEQFDWSSQRYLEHGAYIPEGGLEKLKQFNAILFGAVGSPRACFPA